MIKLLKFALSFVFAFALIALLQPKTLFAAEESIADFVSVPGGHTLYVEYSAPEPGRPTLVVLHGLTYSTWQWREFTNYLKDRGFGVLTYDMFGMGRTLRRYGPVFDTISHSEQVQDLAGLLDELGIEPPYNLAGLSYGAGIATAFAEAFPSKVSRLFLMAPYTEPLKEQDELIKTQINITRAANPFNPLTDDQLYDYFLRNLVYTTYAAAEPIVLEHPFKLEAVFRMIQGIKNYRGVDSVEFFPERSVHLMVASEDQYLSRDVLDSFWHKLPESARGSYLYMQGVEHKVPQAAPTFSAGWIAEILEGGEIFEEGRLFEGDPLKGEAVSGEHSVELPKGIKYVPF